MLFFAKIFHTSFAVAIHNGIDEDNNIYKESKPYFWIS